MHFRFVFILWSYQQFSDLLPHSVLRIQTLLMVLRRHMCVVPEIKSGMTEYKTYPPSALSSVPWNMYFQEDPKEILNGHLTSTQTWGWGTSTSTQNRPISPPVFLSLLVHL